MARYHAEIVVYLHTFRRPSVKALVIVTKQSIMPLTFKNSFEDWANQIKLAKLWQYATSAANDGTGTLNSNTIVFLFFLNTCMSLTKHPKNWETALWGKERLYWKKGLLKERLYWKKGFIERKTLWNLVKIVKIGQNCELLSNFWK